MDGDKADVTPYILPTFLPQLPTPIVQRLSNQPGQERRGQEEVEISLMKHESVSKDHNSQTEEGKKTTSTTEGRSNN